MRSTVPPDFASPNPWKGQALVSQLRLPNTQVGVALAFMCGQLHILNATIRESMLSFADKQDPPLDRPFTPGTSLGELDIHWSAGVRPGSSRLQLKEGSQPQHLVLGQRPQSSSAETPQGLPLCPHWELVSFLVICCICFPFWLGAQRPVCQATDIPGSLLWQGNLAKGTFC